MIDYRELMGEDDPLLPAWLELYAAAFPPDERVPAEEHLEVLRARAQGKPGSARLLAAVDEEDDLVGMARYDLLEDLAAAYLMYLAVVPERRGQGIGGAFYRELLRRLAEEGRPLRALVLEVERPDHAVPGEGRRDAERRIDFYRRLGARLLEGIEYLQQVPGHAPVPMHLMVHPLAGTLDPEEAFTLCAAPLDAERTSEPLRLT
jgi:ribosomal protein S18 acetylase RimI-like enzyme